MKYSFRRLFLELTRKCNYKCAHCMRGSAEDLTITQEIIDTMFSQIETAEIVTLNGGESLLEIDMLAYLLDAIDRYDLKTGIFDFVTNGSILDARLIDLLSSFTSKRQGRTAHINISVDDFHDKAQSEKCLNFYRSINPDNEHIEINYHDADFSTRSGETNALSYSGKAISYIQSHTELNDKPLHGYKAENSIRQHQIKITDGNMIECEILLCVNGNLCQNSSESYSTLDRLSFGNILTDSLHDIITRHNETCPYLCDECENERICYNIAYLMPDDIWNEIEVERLKLQVKIRDRKIKLIWELREWIRQHCPAMTMNEIFLETIIDDHKWSETVLISMAQKLQRDIDKYRQYRKVRAKIKENAIYVATEKAITEYLPHFKRKFPDISEDDAKNLSGLNSLFKYSWQMTLDDLLTALFGSPDLAVLTYKIVEQEYLQEDTAPIDVCGLIPDTFYGRWNEQITETE